MLPHLTPALCLPARGRPLFAWRPWAVWLLCAGFTQAVQAVSPASLDRAAFVALSSSVLKIEVIRQQGGYSLGSGVVVAPEKVVTNCHVTRDARSIVILKHGQRWPAEAQVVDALHDLCLLRVPGVRDGVVERGRSTALDTTQAVHAIGYTGGMGIQSSEGEVMALHPHDGGNVVQSSNWFTSGASGGGLFDDQLKLVGILTFRMRGGEAHYFSAPVEWLAPLLAPGASFTPVGPMAADQLAFWQVPIDRQPDYLQAASLSRDRQWPQLRVVAQRWLDRAQRDPLAWYVRGQAEEGLDRKQEALQAFERSVSLEPRFASGWWRLGLLRLQLGLKQAAAEALVRLEPLNAELARQLAQNINK